MTEGHERVLSWCSRGEGSAVSGCKSLRSRKEEELEETSLIIIMDIAILNYYCNYSVTILN